MAETEQDPNSNVEAAPQSVEEDKDITWTASEFVHHHKSGGWYLGLVVVTALVAGLVYLAARDFVSVAVVIVAGVLMGVYGAHQPRQLEYQVSRAGLSIGQRHWTYDQFKSFSVVPEGAFSSIIFMPLKRFSPITTIYFAPEDEERILATLSNYLPFEEPRRDAVDNLMRRIRF